jgi:ribosomal protein L11 methylase PrmA
MPAGNDRLPAGNDQLRGGSSRLAPDSSTGPPFVVERPVVAGAVDGEEATNLVVAAERLGLVEVVRHEVGGGRLVIELEPVAGSLTDRALAAVVAQLRNDGCSVLAGPPVPGYAGVWARRNAPSWFAPDACVCFPWSPFDRTTARLVVEIDPGAGFGAGGHPTTLGLLRGLVDPTVVGGPVGSGPVGDLADLRGLRVLDVGCGTGVLAIAAALAGAGPVDALDIAPAARSATRANAIRNGVAERVTVIDDDLARCPGPYDLVLANIHAEVLVALAPELRRLTAEPGGLLGVSGLSPSQLSRLEAALRPLAAVGHHRLDDWVCLWFR